MSTQKNSFLLSITALLCVAIMLFPSTITDISRITANAHNYGTVATQEEPITVYSHGLLCNKWVAGIHHCDSLLRSPNAFIQGPMVSFSYNDWLAPLSTCVAQEDDLEQLHAACSYHTRVILAGCSRGAAAIVNYLGKYKPTNVIAAIIESPFDHTRNVIDYIAEQLHITKRDTIDSISTRLAPNHDQNGIQPIDYVAQIDHAIPLFFICTTKDRVIPLESSLELYKVSQKTGHPRTHLWVAHHGAHGLITFSSDGKQMRNVIHAFYRNYILPHDGTWADEGHELFMQSQPSIELLETAYPTKSSKT